MHDPASELRRTPFWRSSAIIQNQGVGKDPSGAGLFASYALACISKRVWAHSTNYKENWLALVSRGRS